MASVFKPKGSKKYVVFYTDEAGRRRKKTLATDKAISQRIARDLENRAALRREGLVDPKADAYAIHEARPLSEHLDAFRAALGAKNGPTKHTAVSSNRARRVLEVAKVRRISGITHSGVLDALVAIRSEGLGQETINHHVRAVKAFARWLWKDGRARDHALAHLATSNSEADRRRVRRALSPPEAFRLVVAAEAGPVVKGMTGPDRARCYLLALGTGFRASELASLTPERFDLASNPPTATVPACYTKNGRQAVQPLPNALAAALAPWLATLPAGRPIFAMPDRTAEMIRVDLAAAGLEYETPSGVADFHSLRGVYISGLVASGASVKVCQTLARHSTPSLTIGLYAKSSLHDIKGAVAALPNHSAPRKQPDALRATGTEGVRGASATGFATDGTEGETQPLDEDNSCVVLAEDLKSSDG